MAWKIEKEWSIDGTWAIRYWSDVSAKSLQISKYRAADDFDKAMKQNYKWHNKWYVHIWNSVSETTKLFNSKPDAVRYAKNYMKTHK